MANKIKSTIKKVVAKAKKPQKKGLATFQDLFLVQLRDLYDTEKQITQALPKIIKKATDTGLKKALSDHLAETENHVKRLEKIYHMLEMKPQGKKSLGMKGLLDDGKEVMSMKAEPELMDAAITCNAQHVEHQEIAGYTATIEWARLLNMSDAADLMQENLDEEIAADEKLTALALGTLNSKASAK